MKKRITHLLLVALIACSFLLTLSGCHKLTEDDIFFPKGEEPANTYMLAQIRGTLILENGYLLIRQNPFFWIKTYPIWPYGYTFEIDGNDVEVYNEDGELVARTGKKLNGCGGETPATWASGSLTDEPLPDDYQRDGKVWIIGEMDPLE